MKVMGTLGREVLPSREFIKRVRNSLDFWEKKFNLTNWSISIKINYAIEREGDEGESPVAACVDMCVPERQCANISISPESPISDLDYLVCHELLHVLFSPRKAMIKVAIDSLLLNPDAKKTLLNLLSVVEEHHVDLIAKTLVEMEPRRWSSKKPKKK